MTKRRKPLNTQDLRTYAEENLIDVASDSALKNCGVLFPQSKQGPESAVEVPIESSRSEVSGPAEGRQKKSLRSIVEAMVEAAADEAIDAAPNARPRRRGASSQRSLGTRELFRYAQENQIEVASEAALKHCGVLQPENRPAAAEQESIPEAAQEASVPSCGENQELFAPTVEIAPPELPGSRKAPRKTQVQEFDIPAIMSEAQAAARDQSDERQSEQSALDYFNGMADGRTYTAELRFRAQFAEDNSTPPSESEERPQQSDENWIQDSFAPPPDEPARINQYADFNNMLDLVDERYQPIPANNPHLGSAQRTQTPEVQVEFTQNSSKLSQRSNGLAGGLNLTNSPKPNNGGSRFKNRWAKKT